MKRKRDALSVRRASEVQRLRVERDRALGELWVEFKRRASVIYHAYQGRIDEARARQKNVPNVQKEAA